MLINIERKLEETGATVFSVKQNKNEIKTFICVIDRRDNDLNGSLDIFVINSEIETRKEVGKYNDMPYLQAYFNAETVTLQELHCDIIDRLYEDQGYATMMVDTLEQLTKASNRCVISGSLDEKDAQTEEKKQKRNNFYINHGFSIEFDDETCKCGSFKKMLR